MTIEFTQMFFVMTVPYARVVLLHNHLFVCLFVDYANTTGWDFLKKVRR